MGKIKITEQYLTDIGNAIRSKNGETEKYAVKDMPNKITALSIESSSAPPLFYERIALPDSNKTQITIAPTWVNISDSMYKSSMYTTLDLAKAASWKVASGSDFTTAANRKGKDFYIYTVPGANKGEATFVLSNNSTVPTGYTADNSRKIGGFHCECADIGTISGHPLSGYVAGDILPTSIWDLNHRPISSPEGMVFDGKKWIDIYLGSWDGNKIVSAFNGIIADGESSKKFHGELFEEEYGKINKTLLSRADFLHCMKGIQENVAIKNATDPNTTGGHVNSNDVRIVSNYGIEDCAGVLWIWGSDLVEGGAYGTLNTGDKTNGYYKYLNGYSWNSNTDSSVYTSSIDGDTPYGACFGWLRRVHFGGSWGDGSNCGSRCSSCLAFSAGRYGNYAARGCSEPLR